MRSFIFLSLVCWVKGDIKGHQLKEGSPFALEATGPDFTNATLNEDGTKECVNTTGLVEVYEQKPVYECVHKEEEQCHYTYITQFLPTRQRECEQSYEKTCKVTYNKVAVNETHMHCYEPLVRECNGQPDNQREVCKDWPETFCSTKYYNKTSAEDQFVSDTSCERIQTRVCVPLNCAMVPGQPQCHERVVPIFHEVPEENCELIPYENCAFKTKLIPKLKAVPICSRVPRQFCQVNFVRGKKIQKEVWTIWCRIKNDTEISTDSADFATDLDATSVSELPNEDTEITVDYDVELSTISPMEEETTTEAIDLTTLPVYLQEPLDPLLPLYGDASSAKDLETTTLQASYVSQGDDSLATNTTPLEVNYGSPPEIGYGSPPETNYGSPPETNYGAPIETTTESLSSYNQDERRSEPIPDYGVPLDISYESPPESNYAILPETSYGIPLEASYGFPPETNYGSPSESLPNYNQESDLLPNYGANEIDSLPVYSNYAAPPIDGYLSFLEEVEEFPKENFESKAPEAVLDTEYLPPDSSEKFPFSCI